MVRIDPGSDDSDGREVYQPEATRGLLIWLSGADTEALARCPRERRKLTGVGGAVLTTAAMAAASFSFALYTGVRAPVWASVTVGLLWGLAIMNLDRWLVAAAQRRDRWYQNLTLALPRLLLALVIGVVVSTPLVLWIFQGEINAQLDLIQQRKRAEYEQTLRSDLRFAKIPQLQTDIEKNQALADGGATDDIVGKDPTVTHWQREFDKADKLYQDAQKAATAELDGTDGTKVPGVGQAYREKQRIANDLKKRRDTIKARLDSSRKAAETAAKESITKRRISARLQLEQDRAELDRLLDLKNAEHDQFVANSGQNRGLLARMDALSEFTGQNGTLRLAYLALMLFITAIEILPVLVKFLMSLGPPSLYDQIVRRADQADAERATAVIDHEQSLTAHGLEIIRAHETELIERVVAEKISNGEHPLSSLPNVLPSRTGAVWRPARRGTARGATPRSGRLRSLLRRDRPTRTPGGYNPFPRDPQPTAPSYGNAPYQPAGNPAPTNTPSLASGTHRTAGSPEPGSARWRYDD